MKCTSQMFLPKVSSAHCWGIFNVSHQISFWFKANTFTIEYLFMKVYDRRFYVLVPIILYILYILICLYFTYNIVCTVCTLYIYNYSIG